MNAVIKHAIVLAILEDGNVHQVALDKEKSDTLLWLINELSEGKIKVSKDPIPGISIKGGQDERSDTVR